MPDFSQLSSNCPIDFVLHLVGAKWSIPIMRDLSQGTKRTSALMRSLTGISPRTLSERLRELEDWQLITRTVYPEIPPRVEYSLTERGREFDAVLIAMETVGARWQRQFDVSRRGSCGHCGREIKNARCGAVDDAQTQDVRAKKNNK